MLDVYWILLLLRGVAVGCCCYLLIFLVFFLFCSFVVGGVLLLFLRVLYVQMGRLLDYDIATLFISLFLVARSVCTLLQNWERPKCVESSRNALWFVFHLICSLSVVFFFSGNIIIIFLVLSFLFLSVRFDSIALYLFYSFNEMNMYKINKHVQRNIKIRERMR